MTTITFDTSEFAFRAAMNVAPKIMNKHFSRATRRSLLEISRTARRGAPKAFTQLASSIQIEMLGPLEGVTGPGTDYGAPVEFGSGPGGYPSIDSLLDWMQVKQIAPEDFSMSDRQLAYVIKQSIGEKGTEPQPYLEPAAEEHEAGVIRRYNDALDAALTEIVSF